MASPLLTADYEVIFCKCNAKYMKIKQNKKGHNQLLNVDVFTCLDFMNLATRIGSLSEIRGVEALVACSRYLKYVSPNEG